MWNSNKLANPHNGSFVDFSSTAVRSELWGTFHSTDGEPYRKVWFDFGFGDTTVFAASAPTDLASPCPTGFVSAKKDLSWTSESLSLHWALKSPRLRTTGTTAEFAFIMLLLLLRHEPYAVSDKTTLAAWLTAGTMFDNNTATLADGAFSHRQVAMTENFGNENTDAGFKTNPSASTFDSIATYGFNKPHRDVELRLPHGYESHCDQAQNAGIAAYTKISPNDRIPASRLPRYEL